jgi:hypothetical protein
MKITQVSAKIGGRTNCGNYNWVDQELWASADVESTDDPAEVLKILQKNLVNQLLSKDICEKYVAKAQNQLKENIQKNTI